MTTTTGTPTDVPPTAVTFASYFITARHHGPAVLSRSVAESTPLEHDGISSRQDKALDLPRPLNGNEAIFLAHLSIILISSSILKPAEMAKRTIFCRFDSDFVRERTATCAGPHTLRS